MCGEDSIPLAIKKRRKGRKTANEKKNRIKVNKQRKER